MFTLFILAEKKAVEPILPLHLFKNSIFNVSSLESFLASALMFCGIIYVPLFAQGVLGMSATNSGLNNDSYAFKSYNNLNNHWTNHIKDRKI